MSKLIIKATISTMPKSFADPLPNVEVTYEDKTTEVLFDFYPDELVFSEDEFIGLTRDAALSLKFIKDQEYLRS